MRSSLFDLAEIKQDTSFKEKKYGHSVYFGLFKGEKRHGFGVMLYKNGRIYEGEWENDFRSGNGYEVYKSAGAS